MTITSLSLRDWFDAAIERPSDERASWLQANCRDEVVRVQVEQLLGADERSGGTVAASDPDPVALSISLGEPAHGLIPVGAALGPFRVLDVLGEGGSSTVYLAARELDGVQQRVALKVLHLNLLSPAARRQFARERRALMHLSHAGIARLVESGVSDEGVAWLALELIDGTDITEYARRQALPLRERMRLMHAVCLAVQAAHGALIVHRDLKPSNVLVTAHGDVKVVDFGIAKWLRSPAEDPTRTMQRAFTPGYSAPEQMGEGPITTATDVYALGVLLGEVVTGLRAPQAGMRLPSRWTGEHAAPDGAARRRLRGDIDNITSKATASEPERRYASAGALADDIERWLRGRPVKAHPPSHRYVWRKFLARNRAAVALTGALAAALVVSLALAIWQGRVARSEAGIARDEAARAAAMRDFMFDAFADAEPDRPRDGPVAVRDVVARALADPEQFDRYDPRVAIEVQLRLAQVARAQGELALSRDVLQRLLQLASTQFGDDDALTRDVAVMLASLERLLGDYPAARRRIDALLAAPAMPPALRARALSLSAVLATNQRDFARARVESAQAMQAAHAPGAQPDDVRALMNERALVLLAVGDHMQAAQAYERLIAANRVQFGANHRAVATALAGAARAYSKLGDFERASERVRAALAIDRALYDGDHFRIAAHLNALVHVLHRRGALAEAGDAALEALAMSRSTLGDQHPDTVNAIYNLGALQLANESYAQAAATLSESLVRSEAGFGAAHVETAWIRTLHGFALGMSGDARGTLELERALRDLRTHGAAEAALTALALEYSLRLALHRGELAQAQRALEALRPLAQEQDASDASWIGNVERLQGLLLLESGEFDAAATVLDRALAHAGSGPSREWRRETQLLLASARQAQGEIDSARAAARSLRAAAAGDPLPPSLARRLESLPE